MNQRKKQVRWGFGISTGVGCDPTVKTYRVNLYLNRPYRNLDDATNLARVECRIRLVSVCAMSRRWVWRSLVDVVSSKVMLRRHLVAGYGTMLWMLLVCPRVGRLARSTKHVTSGTLAGGAHQSVNCAETSTVHHGRMLRVSVHNAGRGRSEPTTLMRMWRHLMAALMTLESARNVLRVGRIEVGQGNTGSRSKRPQYRIRQRWMTAMVSGHCAVISMTRQRA